MENNSIDGQVGDIKFSVDQAVIDRLLRDHGIDVIAEIENALKKALSNENKSTEG